MEETHTETFRPSWNEVHLADVDPNFSLIEDGFYNLKVIEAALKSYDNTGSGGKAGEYIKFAFGVTGDPKYSGRRVYPPPMFINDFNQKILRRIQDASGVQQGSATISSWLTKLQQIGPILKLKVEAVDDVKYLGKNPDGTANVVPNPTTVLPDGSPAKKQVVNYKAGVQAGD